MNQTDNKKILIIEDDKDFLWLLKQGFENQGFLMMYAKDGQEGLDIAQKEKPDLMVVDIDLPKMDGISMAKKIKEHGLNPIVIFLTNLNDAKHVSEAMGLAGQSDYIIKSDMHIEDIVRRVKDKLGLK